MTAAELVGCPLCGEKARLIGAADFHMSFAIYSSDSTVEHNFLHYGAIQCGHCSLTLPMCGEGLQELNDTIAAWNGTYEPPDTSEH